VAKDIDQKLSDIQGRIEEVSDTTHKIDKELALQKAAFEDHMKQDEKMYEEFKRMNDILQINTESLKEHMHRTELLESVVQKMDMRLSPIEIEHIESQAIKRYRKEKLMLMIKIIGALAALVAVGAAVKPILIKLLVI
jgi:DNA replication protein DnaD